jgi:hypothetical protein
MVVLNRVDTRVMDLDYRVAPGESDIALIVLDTF